MADQPRIVTGIGKAELHRILVRGYDLNRDLVGKITFTDMTSLILRGRLPTPNEARMLDALLIILVEHGMVSHVIAARLVYHCAPEAIQAAVAAALCGAGSVHLGSSEWSAKMLVEALPPERDDLDLDQVAASIVEDYSARKQRMPGIGHRTHAEGDPRAETLFAIARETGVYGRYCELIQKLSKAAGERRKRLIPVNVTGAIAAIALDMGFPWQITKAFALIGRTLGVMGHIAEEIRNPMAGQIDAAIKNAIVYEPWRT
ncbi:MAG TPA: citryl-CoA lyase [candidate division Zixibacteria bacterium]|nr:citryl-CoA lyase [candidate division Zixibacteria bacterium]